MPSKPQDASKDGAGHLHAKLVDEAESIMRQFNLPISSISLIDKIMAQNLDVPSAPAQWSAYHQLANVQRLQLESLCNCVQGFNATACTGLTGREDSTTVRPDILRSILLSLSSLMFLRMSTTITMATHGPFSSYTLVRLTTKERTRTLLDSDKLVNNEGLASLRADCELVSYCLPRYQSRFH